MIHPFKSNLVAALKDDGHPHSVRPTRFFVESNNVGIDILDPVVDDPFENAREHPVGVGLGVGFVSIPLQRPIRTERQSQIEGKKLTYRDDGAFPAQGGQRWLGVARCV
jgi:hypothetical protein